MNLTLHHTSLDLESVEGGRRLRVHTGNLEEGDFGAYSVEERATPCGPVREASGFVWDPVEVRLDDQPLIPGAIQRARSTLGIEIYLGRAMRYWTRVCDSSRPVSVDLVELTLR